MSAIRSGVATVLRTLGGKLGNRRGCPAGNPAISG